MSKCESCGYEFDNLEVRFCPKCGNKIKPKIICVYCKKEIPENSSYCIHCGKRTTGDKKNKINISEIKNKNEELVTVTNINSQTMIEIIMLAAVLWLLVLAIVYRMWPLSEEDAIDEMMKIAKKEISEYSLCEKKDIEIDKSYGPIVEDISWISDESSAEDMTWLLDKPVYEFTDKEYFITILYTCEDEEHIAIFDVKGTKHFFSCVLYGIDKYTAEEWKNKVATDIEKRSREATMLALSRDKSSNNKNFDEKDRKGSTSNSENEVNQTDEESLLDKMINDVDKIYLSDKYNMDLLTKEELRILRNSIYAKHGYIFSDNELSNYFSKKDYYNPSVKKAEWNENVLSEIELRNRDLIVSVEEAYNETGAEKEDRNTNEYEESDDVPLKELYETILEESDTERPYDYENEQYESYGVYIIDDYNECVKLGMSAVYETEEEEDPFYYVTVPGIQYWDDNEYDVWIYYKVYYTDGYPGYCKLVHFYYR